MVAPIEIRIGAHGARGMRQQGLESGIIEAPIHGCHEAAQDDVAASHVALAPGDEIVGERLDGLTDARSILCLDFRGFTARDRVEHSDAEAAGGAPGQFRGAKDLGVLGHVRIGSGVERETCSLWWPADAARVEKSEPKAAINVAPWLAEVENITALDEEWPSLGKERLILTEIDDGRIDLDLAEIRVHRR
jgi:hypothetical protein